jgi:uncharacterized protein YcbK (DUF882 family)
MKLKYFKLEEFACPCCGQCDMDDIILQKLDEARDIAGVPFHINSGYRCKEHNKSVGGSPTSSHLRGLAVDIRTTSSQNRYHILDALLHVGFTRLGVGKHFIHADVDTNKVQNVIWDYYEKH